MFDHSEAFEVRIIGRDIWIVIRNLPMNVREIIRNLESLELIEYVPVKRIKEIQGYIRKRELPNKSKLAEFPTNTKPSLRKIRKIGVRTKKISFGGDIELSEKITEIGCEIETLGNIWMPMTKVKAGSKITAGGNITVNAIKGSEITCGGSLMVIGGDINKANVMADGNINILGSILHSELFADGHITVQSQQQKGKPKTGGRIEDSVVIGSLSVVAEFASSHMGQPSIILAGTMPEQDKLFLKNRGHLREFFDKRMAC